MTSGCVKRGYSVDETGKKNRISDAPVWTCGRYESLRMDTDTVGKLCALATALSWAGAIVLFRRGTDHVHPIALNLFKNCIGLVGVVGTLAALWLWRGELPAWPVSLDAEDRRLWILLLSGVGGIAVGDSLVFRGLKLAGVGPVAVVDCLYSPAVVLCSWLMLAEVITAAHLVGGAMIVGAVAVLTLRDRQQDVHRAGLVKGCLYAAAGVLLMAFCIVWAQPELKGLRAELGDTQGILAGTLVRLAGAPRRWCWWAGGGRARRRSARRSRPARRGGSLCRGRFSGRMCRW